jgi:hypothetical protein
VLSLLTLAVPEVRRLLLALHEPPERSRFRLAWSHFRRHHQAVAKRAHQTRRARRLLAVSDTPPVAQPVARGPSPDLTEAQWQRVRPLLPPQKPHTGQPNHDHRQLVAAMLWVERTGCSWRAMPNHFGSWRMVLLLGCLLRLSGTYLLPVRHASHGLQSGRVVQRPP